jgi:SAM-dependent methyltransferase
MAQAVVCPLCRSVNWKIWLRGEDRPVDSTAFGPSRKEVSPGQILRCQECGLGFREWRPTESELAQLYRGLNGALYDAEHQGRASTAMRHLRIVQDSCAPGRLLDVGCASGTFLDCAAKAGWDVVGVEPATTLAENAAQLLAGRGRVFCAALHQAPLQPASFDAVTLWDVLEHVPQPLEFFCSCARLLRPGGHLFLNVPDLDSWPARLLGSHWPLLLPEHLNYFNRPSLRLCGERAQLEWRRFGRRRSSFSVEYVLYRLAQHRILGTPLAHRVAKRSAWGRAMIAVPLGELYGVWRNSPADAAPRNLESMSAA